MPKEGWKTQSLRNQTLERLEQMYAKDTKRPKTQKFTAWLDEQLVDFAEYHEKLQTHGPFIDYMGLGDNHIALFDNFLGRYVTITVDTRGKEKRLHCDVDDDNNCVHVGFCFGHKKIYPLLIDKGIRPPKKVKR